LGRRVYASENAEAVSVTLASHLPALCAGIGLRSSGRENVGVLCPKVPIKASLSPCLILCGRFLPRIPISLANCLGLRRAPQRFTKSVQRPRCWSYANTSYVQWKLEFNSHVHALVFAKDLQEPSQSRDARSFFRKDLIMQSWKKFVIALLRSLFVRAA